MTQPPSPDSSFSLLNQEVGPLEGARLLQAVVLLREKINQNDTGGEIAQGAYLAFEVLSIADIFGKLGQVFTYAMEQLEPCHRVLDFVSGVHSPSVYHAIQFWKEKERELDELRKSILEVSSWQGCSGRAAEEKSKELAQLCHVLTLGAGGEAALLQGVATLCATLRVLIRDIIGEACTEILRMYLLSLGWSWVAPWTFGCLIAGTILIVGRCMTRIGRSLAKASAQLGRNRDLMDELGGIFRMASRAQGGMARLVSSAGTRTQSAGVSVVGKFPESARGKRLFAQSDIAKKIDDYPLVSGPMLLKSSPGFKAVEKSALGSKRAWAASEGRNGLALAVVSDFKKPVGLVSKSAMTFFRLGTEPAPGHHFEMTPPPGSSNKSPEKQASPPENNNEHPHNQHRLGHKVPPAPIFPGPWDQQERPEPKTPDGHDQPAPEDQDRPGAPQHLPPPATHPPQLVPPPPSREYTVRSGDTLTSIANQYPDLPRYPGASHGPHREEYDEEYRVTPESIFQDNKQEVLYDPDVLHQGQVLEINYHPVDPAESATPGR